jgi:hypothetical protein
VRRWWLVIALLLSLGVNLGLVAAVAWRRLSPPPPDPAELPPRAAEQILAVQDPGARLGRLADVLGLEGEVRRKFLDLQWGFFQETGRLRLQQTEIHREIRRELIAGKPDRAKVDRLLAESGRLYQSMEQALARHVLATRDLLDDVPESRFLRLVGRLRPGVLFGPGPEERPERPERPQRPGLGPPPGEGGAGPEQRWQQRERTLRQEMRQEMQRREQQWEQRWQNREEQIRRFREQRLRERPGMPQNGRPRRRPLPPTPEGAEEGEGEEPIV